MLLLTLAVDPDQVNGNQLRLYLSETRYSNYIHMEYLELFYFELCDRYVCEY